MPDLPAKPTKVVSHVRHRVAELVVDVTARMEGSIKDWPANIQDPIYKALADLSLRVKRNYQIVSSYSDTDIDSGPYVHVIAVALEELH